MASLIALGTVAASALHYRLRKPRDGSGVHPNDNARAVHYDVPPYSRREPAAPLRPRVAIRHPPARGKVAAPDPAATVRYERQREIEAADQLEWETARMNPRNARLGRKRRPQ